MQISQNILLKNSLLILGLITLTLSLNAQIISYNMMYFEQPIMYVANQHALTFKNLLHLYLHPQFLQFAIPFFRPSGHFLMYYLLVPIFGWHNTQAFVVINLLFLALSGWLMIKIYKALFPGYVVGGYIGFAIYLMHPATIISRLSIMHFDYAYIFFSLASLYIFILFSKANENKYTFTHYSYLISSIILFMLAATFKEPALMMGPVLFAYFCIVHSKQSLHDFLKNKKVIEILVLLTVCTLVIFFYITSPWPMFFHNPARFYITISERLGALLELNKILFGFHAYQDGFAFRQVITPALAQIIMISCGLLTLTLFIPKTFKTLTRKERQALLFLTCAGMLFLILPVLWAMALGWHLSPSIVFFSLVFGFVLEKRKFGLSLALFVALITLATNYENIHFLENHIHLELKLNSNAVFHPPLAKEKLKPNSIIVEEDSIVKSAYSLGDSIYPFMIQYSKTAIKNYDDKKINSPGKLGTIFNANRKLEEYNLLKYQPTYNGSLFKYAYLMPSLREEVYPFQVEKMQEVPDQVIYNWLQNSKDIFCFGYDKRGHWHDKTALFQKNLQIERLRRNIPVNVYKEIVQRKWQTKSIARLVLLVADPQLCEIDCDKRKDCSGFVMLSPNYKVGYKAQCLLYSNVSQAKVACPLCTMYIKNV